MSGLHAEQTGNCPQSAPSNRPLSLSADASPTESKSKLGLGKSPWIPPLGPPATGAAALSTPPCTLLCVLGRGKQLLRTRRLTPPPVATTSTDVCVPEQPPLLLPDVVGACAATGSQDEGDAGQEGEDLKLGSGVPRWQLELETLG